MPIYEYRCQACGATHEAIQKSSDDPLVDCPSCGQPELRKQVSAPAFRLKGGGWYETDFKTGDNKKNLAGDAGKSDTPSDSKPSATSADAKPAGSASKASTKT